MSALSERDVFALVVEVCAINGNDCKCKRWVQYVMATDWVIYENGELVEGRAFLKFVEVRRVGGFAVRDNMTQTWIVSSVVLDGMKIY